MINKEDKKYIHTKLDLLFARIGGAIFRFWRWINVEITKLVELYFDAKEKSKNLVGTNLNVAQEHIKNNNLYDAILRYKIVLRMQKNNFEALYGLSFIYLKLGEFKKAIQYLERSLEQAEDEEMKQEISKTIERTKQKFA